MPGKAMEGTRTYTQRVSKIRRLVRPETSILMRVIRRTLNAVDLPGTGETTQCSTIFNPLSG
jgi:DUF1009 family protein